MQPHPRYDIIAQIASGDFASVFRARDKELARDVAIKQIHPHFLADPKQLNRYWEEAQILASLEHPNVLTIYDLDRERGWLILELMTDTMQPRSGGQPLDLDLIRMGLICGLKALQFLHKSNIIHGDVKPNNLLIDRRNWIKLADFGFAQRATNDQGSLFKGTTRYIAPERVDPERFGPVGPASDLYSLGFSMYELLCGNAFDSLFPGLSAFGSDRQIAWMMWHAGADRKMPQISRVLKGVPEDLATVIERLVTKDPKVRYRDAEEAIRDLKIGMGKGSIGPTEAEKAEAEAAALEEGKKKRKKKLLIAAVCSLTLSLLLLFLIPAPQKRLLPEKIIELDGQIVQIVPVTGIYGASDDSATEAVPKARPPILGKFVVDADRIVIEIKNPKDSEKNTEDTSKEKKLKGRDKKGSRKVFTGPNIKGHQTLNIASVDQVYVNDELVSNDPDFGMQLFEIGDSVRMEEGTDRTIGRNLQIIYVARPVEDSGFIIDVQPKKRAFVLKSSSNSEKLFLIRIPNKIVIEVNGTKKTATPSEAVKLLKANDQVEVSHNALIQDGKQQDVRIAKPKSTIRVTRTEVTTGTIQNADPAQREITVRTRNGDQIQIPLAEDCEVVLNGRESIGGQKLSLSDLQYKDTVSVRHNTHASRIIAERTSTGQGEILQVFPAARKLRIRLEDANAPIATYQVPESVSTRLGSEPVSLKELQPTDLVKIKYDATDPKNPVLSQLTVNRPPDRRRWALVIGLDTYNDRTLSPVTHLGMDAKSIADTLTTRYRVPIDQTLELNNTVRAELKSKVASFLRRIQSDGELLVYYGGHAFLDRNRQPQLATKNFKLLDPTGTGLPLKWLIGEIESCQAKEKLLFLDTCHEGSGNDLRQEPSSERQIQTLEEDRAQPALKTLTVIVSCGTNQRGLRNQDGGYFAHAIREAYRGNADTNFDQHITLTEVSKHIRQILSKKTRGTQTPIVIKPGKIIPPRFSPEIIEQMHNLAEILRRREVTPIELAPLVTELQAADSSEPEPILLCGLAEIHLGNFRNAISILEEASNNPIALQGIIWSHYNLRDYDIAINPLIALIQESSRDLMGEEQSAAEAERVLAWAGRLREYAATAAPERDRISEIDAESIDETASTAGTQANRNYTAGRESVKERVDKFNRQIEDALSSAVKSNIRNKKIKLSNYTSFNLPLLVRQVARSVKDDR